jgi:hypothetical protein
MVKWIPTKKEFFEMALIIDQEVKMKGGDLNEIIIG